MMIDDTKAELESLEEQRTKLTLELRQVRDRINAIRWSEQQRRDRELLIEAIRRVCLLKNKIRTSEEIASYLEGLSPDGLKEIRHQYEVAAAFYALRWPNDNEPVI